MKTEEIKTFELFWIHEQIIPRLTYIQATSLKETRGRKNPSWARVIKITIYIIATRKWYKKGRRMFMSPIDNISLTDWLIDANASYHIFRTVIVDKTDVIFFRSAVKLFIITAFITPPKSPIHVMDWEVKNNRSISNYRPIHTNCHWG